jgi:chromosome segregation ATPase
VAAQHHAQSLHSTAVANRKVKNLKVDKRLREQLEADHGRLLAEQQDQQKKSKEAEKRTTTEIDSLARTLGWSKQHATQALKEAKRAVEEAEKAKQNAEKAGRKLARQNQNATDRAKKIAEEVAKIQKLLGSLSSEVSGSEQTQAKTKEAKSWSFEEFRGKNDQRLRWKLPLRSRKRLYL